MNSSLFVAEFMSSRGELGPREWFEQMLDMKAALIDDQWDRCVWRWDRHLLQRMVDREISVKAVVELLNEGVFERQSDQTSWRVTHNGVLVVVRFYTPGVYMLATCWRVNEIRNRRELAERASFQAVAYHVLGLELLF